MAGRRDYPRTLGACFAGCLGFDLGGGDLLRDIPLPPPSNLTLLFHSSRCSFFKSMIPGDQISNRSTT